MKDYRRLKIWERSHRLAVRIYESSKSLPKDELYGLVSQMRRAAVSIPTNIAEGCGRDGDPELKRFLTISLGSACELDYLVLLATELQFLDARTSQSLADEILKVRRMIGMFVQKLKA